MFGSASSGDFVDGPPLFGDAQQFFHRLVRNKHRYLRITLGQLKMARLFKSSEARAKRSEAEVDITTTTDDHRGDGDRHVNSSANPDAHPNSRGRHEQSTDAGPVAERAPDFGSALFAGRRSRRFRCHRAGQRHDPRAAYLDVGRPDKTSAPVHQLGKDGRHDALVSRWKAPRLYFQSRRGAPNLRHLDEWRRSETAD